MAGHSKWSKIKRQKQVNDVAKGARFAKLSRAITMSVIEGGGITDPALNIKLRLAIDKARQENMPKDTIERAIEKGTGPHKEMLKAVMYEGFAPHGVSLLISATTDNPNRTLNEVRYVLEMDGGKLGSQGAVSYLFEQCGLVRFDTAKTSEESVLKAAGALQAIDIEQDDTAMTVYIPFDTIGKVKDLIGDMSYTGPEVDFKPQSHLTLSSMQQEEVMTVLEKLEKLDDVQTVYANVLFTEGE
jgi:YebC/PmpR family DNA-binding regulatory protein